MDDVNPPAPGAFDRRSVLVGSLALAALAACKKDEPAAVTTSAPEPPSSTRARDTFVPVLAAIAERLLPSDDLGPGAKEADVAGFLRGVFDDQRLASVHPLLKRGAAFLMKAAQLEGQKPFVDLDDAAKDDLLQRLGDNLMRPDGFHGPTFVRVMLALTLEGFLGDPRHGGNKDGVGWRIVGFSQDSRASGLAQNVAAAPGLKVVP